MHFSLQGTSLRFVWAAISVSQAASSGGHPSGPGACLHPVFGSSGVKAPWACGGEGCCGGQSGASGVGPQPENSPKPSPHSLLEGALSRPGHPASRSATPPQDPAVLRGSRNVSKGPATPGTPPQTGSSGRKLRAAARRPAGQMTKFGSATCHRLPFMVASWAADVAALGRQGPRGRGLGGSALLRELWRSPLQPPALPFSRLPSPPEPLTAPTPSGLAQPSPEFKEGN